MGIIEGARSTPTEGGHAGGLIIADATVPAASVLTLNNAAVTLLAAPGANKAIIFEGAVIHKPAGTAYAAVAADDDLAIRYTNGSGLVVGECEMTGFADSTSAQTRYIRAYSAASAESQITPVANAVLVAHMLNGEITTGDSDFLFRIYYRVIDTVLA